MFEFVKEVLPWSNICPAKDQKNLLFAGCP
jgi:hypothetical protein